MKAFRLALLAISLALLALIYFFVDVSKTAQVLVHADLLMVGASIACVALSLSLKTLRWRALLAEKRTFSFAELFPIQVAGMAASSFSPGKALEVVKVLPLKRKGLDYSFGLLTVFWERAIDLLIIFAFAIAAVSTIAGSAALLVYAAFAALVILMAVMFRHYGALLAFLKGLGWVPFVSKISPHHFKTRTMLVAVSFTLAGWAFDGLIIYFAMRAVGLDLNYFHLAGAYFASVLVGVISLLPLGLGSTEASFLLFLSPSSGQLTSVLAGELLARAIAISVTSLLGFILLHGAYDSILRDVKSEN